MKKKKGEKKKKKKKKKGKQNNTRQDKQNKTWNECLPVRVTSSSLPGEVGTLWWCTWTAVLQTLITSSFVICLPHGSLYDHHVFRMVLINTEAKDVTFLSLRAVLNSSLWGEGRVALLTFGRVSWWPCRDHDGGCSEVFVVRGDR